MKFFTKAVLLSAAFLVSATVGTLSAKQAQAEEQFFTIGTAGVTGVYYPAGGAICRLVTRGRKEHGIRCTVESTGGSIYNLNAIRQGELDMGVAQSDWQYHAYNGTALFARLGADKDLRSVFSLHSEPFTVVARRDSGIKTFDDLKGKRVNIGNPGSGMRATMEVLMKEKGWTMDDFKRVFEMKASEQGQALCDNNIDAMIYAAGHPNGAIQEVTTTCDAVLVPVEGEAVDQLVEEFPFYTYATIPGGMYVGNPDDVKSFGVKATFVSSDKVSEEMIYQVVKAVFDNFDAFKTLHPVFSTLNPKDMIEDGNTAPLHKGAERYFREKGLLK
jgi:TRAP transporter TAXI family solute receptor